MATIPDRLAIPSLYQESCVVRSDRCRPFSRQCWTVWAAFTPAMRVAHELFCHDLVHPRVSPKTVLCLFLAVIKPVGFRPFRPGIIRLTGVGAAAGFQIARLLLVTQSCANTVCAGITTANDNDVLIGCRKIVLIFVVGVQQAFGIGVQEFHGEMDPGAVDREWASPGAWSPHSRARWRRTPRAVVSSAYLCRFQHG